MGKRTDNLNNNSVNLASAGTKQKQYKRNGKSFAFLYLIAYYE